jgi:hypothetical protein
VLAENLEFTAIGFFAGAADFTVAAGDTGVDGDAIPRLEGGDFRANRLDLAGTIGSDDMRKAEGDALDPLSEEKIEVIERGGPDPDSDLTLTRHWRLGKIEHRECLGPAESG